MHICIALQERHHRVEGASDGLSVTTAIVLEYTARPLGDTFLANSRNQLHVRIEAVGNVCLLSTRPGATARPSFTFDGPCNAGSFCGGNSLSRRLLRPNTHLDKRRNALLLVVRVAVAAAMELGELVGMVPRATPGAPALMQTRLHILHKQGLHTAQWAQCQRRTSSRNVTRSDAQM